MEPVAATLRALPLFAGLPREILARLVGELEEVVVPAGGTAVVQGGPGDAMYVIASGTLEVRVEREGRSEPLAAFGPGDWFGEMALLTGEPRSATVVALSQSRLWRLDKDRFLALSERYPALLREVVRVLCQRLMRTSKDAVQDRQVYTQAFKAVVEACDPAERELLFLVALAERPDATVLEALRDRASADESLAALAGRHPAFLQRRDGGLYALHPRFREYLLEQLRREEGPEAVATLHASLAAIHERRQDYREAITHRLGAGDWAAAVRLLRQAQASTSPPTEADLAAWLDRLPEPVVLAVPDLVRTKAELLARQGQGEAAVLLYRRALAAESASAATREALIRGLADHYVARGEVEQALLCLREHASDEGGEAGPLAALQEEAAARHLAAGRRTEAYAWGRSARALSRAAQDALASPVRRARLVQGWSGIALALVAGALVLILPPSGLPAPGVRLLATLVAAAVLWVRGQPPDYVVALGMGAAWVLLGVAPARGAFGGFATSTWFLMLAVLGLGAALGRSGLLYRITLLAFRRCPPTFGGQVLALGLAGAASTLCIPSVQGRMTLVAPSLAGLADTFGYPPRSRGSAGLAFGALVGFSLTTTLFLTGTATCLLAWRMLPEATRDQITWGRWLVGVAPLEALTFLGAIGWIVWRYRPDGTRRVRRGLVDAQLEALGALSREEWKTLAIAAALLVGWLTQPLHGVDPAWIALAGFCVLVAAGILDRSALRTEVDWPFLLFMGMVFSLADLTEAVGASTWFARIVSVTLGGASMHPAVAVATAVLVTVAIRFLLPWQTAVPLLTVALTPFAQQAGFSPWIMALVALKAGNVFLLPYQSPYYLTLYYGTEERAFTHAQARPFAWAYVVIVLAAFLLSLPYWRALGLA